MFRFLRIRYLLLYALVIYGASFLGWQWALERPVRYAIDRTLAQYGVTHPSYTIDALSGQRFHARDIRLDKDGINTIESITVTYSPWSLIWGRVKDMTITAPDFIFGDDVQWKSDATSGGFKIPKLKDLPFDNLTIKNLSLSLATNTINPNIGGDVTFTTTADGTRALLLGLKGAQKDFTLALNGTITETRPGGLNIKIDIPQAKMDLPHFMMSRAHGTLELDYVPGSPLSANGEWVAGAMRIGNVPLDGVSIIARGRKPDFSVIGNAGISGAPMTNISLRIAEDADSAQILAQISGESPQKLARILAPDMAIPFPSSQKFVATIDFKDTDLAALFSYPHKGNVFLYDEGTAPFISAAVECHDTVQSCTLKLPRTALNVPEVNQFLEPAMAEYGLSLLSGKGDISGAFYPFAEPTPQFQLQTKLDNISGEWQGLAFRKARADITLGLDGAASIKDISINAFDGTIKTSPLHLNTEHSGVFSVTLNKIDLAQLSKFARVQGLAVTGRASGTLPIQITQGTPKITKGGSIASVSGTLKYAPKSYPPFLSGADDRMNVLRNALENYKFDSLDLDFSGDPMGDVSATLAAKGRNETLFGKRPIHINLKIDGPLAPAIKQLLPYMGSNDPTETEGSDK
jgi:hypothetical protein